MSHWFIGRISNVFATYILCYDESQGVVLLQQEAYAQSF